MQRLSLSLVLLCACGGPAFTEGIGAGDAGTDVLPPDDGRWAADEGAFAEASDAQAPSEAGVEARYGEHPDADAEGGDEVVEAAGGSDACVLVTHSDGLGQSWQDCAPLGTFDLAEALAACAAGSGALSCYAHLCTDGSDAGTFDAACGPLSCWGYDGLFAGKVSLPASGGCPSSIGMTREWR